MAASLPIQILIIIVLLIFSAFFSGAETAFFSINYIVLEKLKQEKKKRTKLVTKMLKSPNKLLITLLLGNMIVNILATAMTSNISIDITKKLGGNDITGVTVSIIVMTLILIFFGEITPKLITVQKPVKYALNFVYLLYFFSIILKPITIIFQLFTDFITNKVMKNSTDQLVNKDIESMITIGHKEGIIDKEEKEMFENVYDSLNKEVQDIMIAKPKMFALSIDLPLKQLIQEIVNCDYTLIPLYKKNREHILGIIHKKSILPYFFNFKKLTSINSLIRPIIFSPVSKKVNDLLREFQTQKKEFSVVVDEYGNVIGFITLDEIIEEIMGEYKDEYDKQDYLAKKIGKNKYLVRGDLKIDEFNEFFKASLRSDESNTIIGLILESLEKIPKKGEKIILDKFIFTINNLKGTVIDSIIVEEIKGN